MLLTTVLLVCIAMAGIGKASPATVAVDPQSVEDLEAGESFTVDITVTDVTDLIIWEVEMTFDPAVLNVENATDGPFLQQFGETIFFPVVIDNTVGTVIIGGSFNVPYPENGATGSGVLTTITFTVKGYGTTELDPQPNLYTVKGWNPMDIPHTTVKGVFRNRGAGTILNIQIIVGIVVAAAIGGIAVFFFWRRRTISET